MTRRTRAIGLLSTMYGLVAVANAQEVPRHIRFVTASASGDIRWEGYLERLTPDSLRLRVSNGDTSATIVRTAIRTVERELPVREGHAAGIGCLTGGLALGALGYFGTRDPDSPGLENTAGALGAAVGCGLGVVGGLLVSAVHSQRWEAWSLPDSVQVTVPP
jgi:hypothetical protein